MARNVEVRGADETEIDENENVFGCVQDPQPLEHRAREQNEQKEHPSTPSRACQAYSFRARSVFVASLCAFAAFPYRRTVIAEEPDGFVPYGYVNAARSDGASTSISAS